MSPLWNLSTPAVTNICKWRVSHRRHWLGSKDLGVPWVASIPIEMGCSWRSQAIACGAVRTEVQELNSMQYQYRSEVSGTKDDRPFCKCKPACLSINIISRVPAESKQPVSPAARMAHEARWRHRQPRNRALLLNALPAGFASRGPRTGPKPCLPRLRPPRG